MNLAFGLNNAAPETAKAVWGCRAIVTQDGMVDVPFDRQDLAGDDRRAKDHLKDWLNSPITNSSLRHGSKENPYCRWQKNAGLLLREGKIETRAAKEVVLHLDEKGVIVGNTNASAGYLYVAAWLHPDGVPPPAEEK